MKTENKTASEILQKYGRAWFDEEAEMENETSHVEYIQALEAMEEYGNQRFSEGKKEAEWIDVKERLPEERGKSEFSDKVLIIDSNTNIDIARYDFGYKSWNKIFYAGEKVTHWMPLPKTPSKL